MLTYPSCSRLTPETECQCHSPEKKNWGLNAVVLADPGLNDVSGIGISFGTDSSASNNRLDILGEMRLASLMTKGKSGNPEILTPIEVLRMATIEGAKALGLESVTGSIEKNKKAYNLLSTKLQKAVDTINDMIKRENTSFNKNDCCGIHTLGMVPKSEITALNE